MTARVQAGVLAALLVAVCGLAVLAVRHGPFPAPADEVVLDMFSGGAAVIAGVLLGRWRPANRTAWLLVLVGAATLAGLLVWANGAVLFTVGGLLAGAQYPVIAHLLLALPDGRLAGRADRRVAGGIYGLAALGTIVPNLFYECRSAFGFGCPGNLLLVRADQGMVDRSERVLGALAVLATGLVILRLVRRWRAAGPPLRRVLGPPFAATAPLAGVAAADVLRLWDPFGQLAGLVRPLALSLLPAALLIGALRARARAGSLGAFVGSVEPGASRSTDELQHALARALDDPTVRLLPASLDDADGDLSQEDGRLRLPVIADGAPLAVLDVDPGLQAEPEVLDAVLATARLALRNEQLAARVQEQLAEVRASRARLLSAQDEERRRIERDLHDGAQQRLVSAQLLLRLAASADANPQLLDDCANVEAEIARAIDELRSLARGVHPSLVHERGLAAAVDSLAERAAIPVEVHGAPPRLRALTETTAYFVVAEALTNVAKHARATHALVSMRLDDGRLLVEIVDDGFGGVDLHRGTGLTGLRDRVEAAGGELTVDSPTGVGTAVRAALPAQEPAEEVLPLPTGSSATSAPPVR